MIAVDVPFVLQTCAFVSTSMRAVHCSPLGVRKVSVSRSPPRTLTNSSVSVSPTLPRSTLGGVVPDDVPGRIVVDGDSLVGVPTDFHTGMER